MRRLVLILLGLVALVVLALLAAPALIPTETYRKQIETAASDALGRKVTVTGPIRIGVIPRIEARAGGAAIANAQGFGDKPFASMGELRIAVKLLPLLSSRVEVDEFVLVQPDIALAQAADGTNNWTFNFAKSQDKKSTSQGPVKMSGSLGDVRIVKGKVSFDDRKSGSVQTLSDLDLTAHMRAIDQPFDIDAKGLANANPFKLTGKIDNPKALLDGAASPVAMALETDLMRTNVTGTLATGKETKFDFVFDSQIPSAVKLADAFKVKDLPARNVLGRLSASGRAMGSPEDMTLKVNSARHESPLLNFDFTGDVHAAKEAVTVNGSAKAEAPKLADLAKAMSVSAPGSEALGRATAQTKVSGALNDLRFTDVDFRHESPLLGVAFKGAARVASEITYEGRVGLNAPNLRGLAQAVGAKLPDGPVYKSFSLTGDTSGSAKNVLLKNAVVTFDAIKGEGEAALTFAGKPTLVGRLSTNAFDVTEYAAASGAPKDKDKKAGVWGKDPIDLSPLKLANADLTLDAAGVKYQKFDFGPSKITVNLTDGKLVANLNQTSLFGGKGAATVTADGSGATPKVALKANMTGLSLKPFLGAAAGFDMLEGSGDLNVDLNGAGATLDTLMSSFQGNGKFLFNDGMLKGVDIGQLVSSAKDTLAGKGMPLNAFGSSAQTKFSKLSASFGMKAGVAAMNDLKFDAGGVAVTGGGALDVGKQQLSLSLYPEMKAKSGGVNGYGLPLKVSGSWNNVKAGFDYDWLKERLASNAKAKLTDEVDKQLKKQLGGNFSSILGAAPAADTTPAAKPADKTKSGADAAPAAKPADAAPAPKPEKAARDAAKKALGNLLGK